MRRIGVYHVVKKVHYFIEGADSQGKVDADAELSVDDDAAVESIINLVRLAVCVRACVRACVDVNTTGTTSDLRVFVRRCLTHRSTSFNGMSLTRRRRVWKRLTWMEEKKGMPQEVATVCPLVLVVLVQVQALEAILRRTLWQHPPMPPMTRVTTLGTETATLAPTWMR